MQLISNYSFSNHHQKFLSLVKQSTEIFIASPFLAEDFCTLFDNILLNKLKSITLVTTFLPKTQDQIKKVYSLYSLITNYKNNKALSIYIDNKLHSKVYFFKKDRVFFSGIITSANFTFQGMVKNHETGIELNSNKILSGLQKMILSQPEVEKFNKNNIFDMKQEVDDYQSKSTKPPSENIKLDLSKYLKNKTLTVSNSYWLKPIGVTEEPIDPSEIFEQEKLDLYFSKKRPTGVRIGDLVITYGVGPTNILSLYQVISEPLYVTEAQRKKNPWTDRWPWYVRGKNLSRKYGKIWAKKDLKLHTLVEEYKKFHSTSILTDAGGATLGALNYGLDKVRLRKEFAEFIIGRVYQYNN